MTSIKDLLIDLAIVVLFACVATVLIFATIKFVCAYIL